MSFYDNFILALKNVKNHKTNSLLSSIGIIISTLILFVLISLSSQISTVLNSSFSEFGANTVVISPNSMALNFQSINESDFDDIKNSVNSVKSISPLVSKTGKILDSDNDISVLFSNDSFKDIFGAELLFGEFYSKSDYSQAQKNVVITKSTALELFGFTDCVGQKLEINVESSLLKLNICGVIEDKNASIFGFEKSSNVAIVPLSVLSKSENLLLTTQYYILNKSIATEQDAQNIKDFLSNKYSDISNSYSFAPIVENSEKLKNGLKYFNLFMSITLVSLFLCVGVWLSNTTVNKVYNRKNELAIKKALGAKMTDIIVEMILETMILCVFGAVLGLVFGGITVLAISVFSNLEICFNIYAFMLPLVFWIIIGLFSSFCPTLKIIRLYPMSIIQNQK